MSKLRDQEYDIEILTERIVALEQKMKQFEENKEFQLKEMLIKTGVECQ